MKRATFSFVFSNRPSTYKKLSYMQKLSVTNRKLRIGDITKVAESTGFSVTHVSDVAAGKYVNESIVNSLYDLTRGRISNPSKINKLS